MTEQVMVEWLKGQLTEKRFEHSLGVCRISEELAVRFGADRNKAYIAGLLHDCAKNIDYLKALELCDEYNISLSDTERKNPALIHAPLGAELAIRQFDVVDDDIYMAIRSHTVGRAGMSVLEKIVYIADMAEESRSFFGVEKIRKMLYEDLDRAVLMGLRFSLELNLNRGNLIHTNTVDAWNDIILSKESE